MLTCIEEQPFTLKASIYISKKLFDIIILYETGDLTKNILNSVFKIFFNFIS